MTYRHGRVPPRKGYARRPAFLAALGAMEVLDVLVWDYMSAAAFHSAIKHQPVIEGMRFRTFKDQYRGKLKLFVVRVL